jgi:hypothetical protein
VTCTFLGIVADPAENIPRRSNFYRCCPLPPPRAGTLDTKAVDDLPLLIDVPRAATIIGISRASAYRLAASGELPSKRLGGRIFIYKWAVRAFVGEA